MSGRLSALKNGTLDIMLQMAVKHKKSKVPSGHKARVHILIR